MHSMLGTTRLLRVRPDRADNSVTTLQPASLPADVGGVLVLTGLLAVVTTLFTEIAFSKACPKAIGLVQCAGATYTLDNTKGLAESLVLPDTVQTAQSRALLARSAGVRLLCGFA